MSTSDTKSTSSTLQSVISYFDFKRPIALLLLTILTLYPTPSPLFHSIFLPIFILLHRHDRKAFTVSVSVCLGLVTFVAQSGGGREGWYSSIMTAREHASMITGAIMGAVMFHYQITALGNGRTAWSECILFGVVWISSSAICRGISSHAYLTPSSARYESLRFLLRNFGEVGNDFLLSTSGYLVFMVLEIFFPVPSEDDRKIRDWIRMETLGVDKDAKALGVVEWSPLTTTLGYAALDEMSGTEGASSNANVYVDNQTRSTGRSYSAPTRSTFTSETLAFGNPHVTRESRSYGSITTASNLIDIESGRAQTQYVTDFGFSSIGTSGPIGPSDITNTGYSIPSNSRLTATTTESAEMGGIETTLVPSSDSANRLATEILNHILASRPKAPRHLRSTILALLFLWAGVLIQRFPSQISLSASLNDHTPLSVACIVPPLNASSRDLIYLSQTASGRVKLIVWPEDAVVVGTELDRDIVVEQVRKAVGVQYGVWTLMNVYVQERRSRETVLVGSDGVVETSGTVMDWTVWLPPPHGVTNFNWTTTFPHFRPIHFTSTPPSGQSHDPPYPASVYIIPARSSSTADSSRHLVKAQEIAIKHNTPAVLCSSSDTGTAISGVIDPAGRILFQQSGGQSWSLSLALWYVEGKHRAWTGYEESVGTWILGIAVTILSIQALMVTIVDRIYKTEEEISSRVICADSRGVQRH